MKMRRTTKQFVLVTILTVIVLIITAMAFVVYMKKRIDNTYSAQIKERDEYIEQSRRVVLRAVRTIQAGEVIVPELFETVVMLNEQTSEFFLKKEEIKANTVALITIPSGSHVLDCMVITQEDIGALREVQYSAVSLTDNVVVNDIVDVRITYPNGEDYVILSKKTVKPGSEEDAGARGTCYFWLTEEEILRMSAAMVDAYLYTGSMIYTTKYIAPNIQEASHVTYVPSVSLVGLILNNPNVVERAQASLSSVARKELENRLADAMETDVKDADWVITDEDLKLDAEIEAALSSYLLDEAVENNPVPTATPTPVPGEEPDGKDAEKIGVEVGTQDKPEGDFEYGE